MKTINPDDEMNLHSCKLLAVLASVLLLPASALFGGIFLVWSNTISLNFSTVVKSLTGISMGTVILPVGIVTALFGAPFFLYLLLTKK